MTESAARSRLIGSWCGAAGFTSSAKTAISSDPSTSAVRTTAKITKYCALVRVAPDVLTKQRIDGLVAELESKLREIDE
jgi:hypothetical protein